MLCDPENRGQSLLSLQAVGSETRTGRSWPLPAHYLLALTPGDHVHVGSKCMSVGFLKSNKNFFAMMRTSFLCGIFSFGEVSRAALNAKVSYCQN